MGDTVSHGSGCSNGGYGGCGGRAAPPMRAELGGVVVLGGGVQAAKLATVSGFLSDHLTPNPSPSPQKAGEGLSEVAAPVYGVH